MFRFDQKVLFKHCDPAGIVFYPRYFEMINDCVEAFFDHLGHPFEVLHQSAAVPTARIDTQFTAPSRHGDHLTLTLAATKLGRSSLDLSINAQAGDQTRFTCTSTLVYITQLGKPTPWPDDLRAALTPHIRSTT
ncbi:MAG: thioesterase family protein [Sulfitobacter sp.]